jgi:hypothetical protein
MLCHWLVRSDVTREPIVLKPRHERPPLGLELSRTDAGYR